VTIFDPSIGWFAVPDLLTSAEATSIHQRCNELLGQPEAEQLVGDKPHSGTHHLVELDTRVPLVAELLSRRRLRDAVSSIMGAHHQPLQISYRSPLNLADKVESGDLVGDRSQCLHCVGTFASGNH